MFTYSIFLENFAFHAQKGRQNRQIFFIVSRGLWNVFQQYFFWLFGKADGAQIYPCSAARSARFVLFRRRARRKRSQALRTSIALNLRIGSNSEKRKEFALHGRTMCRAAACRSPTRLSYLRRAPRKWQERRAFSAPFSLGVCAIFAHIGIILRLFCSLAATIRQAGSGGSERICKPSCCAGKRRSGIR